MPKVELKKILAEILYKDEGKIKETSRLKEDLGADSLDLIELELTLEGESGTKIRIPQRVKTVSGLSSYIKTKGIDNA